VVNTSYSLVKFIPKVKDAATFLIQQVGSMSKGKDDEKAEPVIIDSENIPEEDDLKLDSDPSEKSEVLVDA
jgi:hypothetical protein